MHKNIRHYLIIQLNLINENFYNIKLFWVAMISKIRYIFNQPHKREILKGSFETITIKVYKGLQESFNYCVLFKYLL